MPIHLDLTKMCRELDRFGENMNHRRSYHNTNIWPDAQLLPAHGRDCFWMQSIFFETIVANVRDFLQEAADIKADNTPPLADAVVPVWDDSARMGKLYAFTPTDMSQAGLDQWNLDKFAANQDPYVDATPIIDCFVDNNELLLEDMLLFEGRLVYWRKAMRDYRMDVQSGPKVKTAAREIMAFIRNGIHQIRQAQLYIGMAEAEYQEYLNPPMSYKEKQKIARAYIRNNPVPIDKARMLPIGRAKVPAADRDLLVRNTQDQLDSLQ